MPEASARSRDATDIEMQPFWQPAATTSLGRRNPKPSKGRYSDDRWDFRELVPNEEMADPCVVIWTKVPAAFIPCMKSVAFELLHAGAPSWFVNAHGHATERFPSAFGFYKAILDWRSLAAFLESRGARSFSDCSPDDYVQWAEATILDRGLSRTRVKSSLFNISRLWAGLQITDGHAQSMPQPPWYGVDALSEYLPSERSGGENLTPVIPESTVSLLLHESLKFLNEFAGPILEARDEYRDLFGRVARKLEEPQGSTGSQCQKIRGYLEDMMRLGKDIPQHQGSVARTAIAAQLGVNPRFFSDVVRRRPDLRNYAAAHQERAILPGARRHSLTFQGWESGIPMDDVEEAVAFLGTAAFIVISYLTGMRPSEVLNLQRGCLRASSVDADRQVLAGRVSKNRHGGIDQDEWLAIAPVAHAVRVLERMSDSTTLFAQSAIGVTAQPQSTKSSRPLLTKTMSDRVAWLCRRIESNSGLPMTVSAGQYPTTRMFRRTVAWYIARRPGGLVALSFQYKHLRSLTSAGYAARRRDGFPQLVAVETMRFAAEFLANLANNPEHISGPSADKLVASVDEFRTEFLGTTLSDRQLTELARSGRFPVYINDDLHVACHFDPAKAACIPRAIESQTPRIQDCVNTCANAASTDGLMTAADAAAERWVVIAERPETSPFVGERLKAAAAAKRRRVEQHQLGAR